jgi:hypothetical protein
MLNMKREKERENYIIHVPKKFHKSGRIYVLIESQLAAHRQCCREKKS